MYSFLKYHAEQSAKGLVISLIGFFGFLALSSAFDVKRFCGNNKDDKNCVNPKFNLKNKNALVSLVKKDLIPVTKENTAMLPDNVFGTFQPSLTQSMSLQEKQQGSKLEDNLEDLDNLKLRYLPKKVRDSKVKEINLVQPSNNKYTIAVLEKDKISEAGAKFVDFILPFSLSVNELPTLINNTLKLAVNETVTLTNENLAATDANHDPSSLVFKIDGLQHGNFKLVATGQIVNEFSQRNITDKKIQFWHDGSLIAPIYMVGVSNGQVISPYNYASINFTCDSPAKYGNEFSVYNGINSGSLVNKLTDDKFAVIWLSFPNLLAKIFYNNATEYIAEFNVARHCSWASSIGLTNDKFAVTWNSGGGIMGQVFHSNGTVYGSEFQIDVGAEIFYVDKLFDDKFLVTWDIGDNNVASTYSIFGKIFFNNGTKFSSEFDIAKYCNWYSASGLTDNKFVVAWSQAGGGYGQTFYHNATAYSSVFSINPHGVKFESALTVAGLTNDKLVAIGCIPTAGYIGQIYYNNGTKYNSDFLISSNCDPKAALWITNIANDKFLVMWREKIDTGAGQVFYNNGTKYGSMFYMITSFFSVSELTDGKFVVVFRSFVNGDKMRGHLFTLSDVAPKLVNNKLTIHSTSSIVLSAEELNATDEQLAREELIFFASEIKHGKFRLIDKEIDVTNFTQQQVDSKNVSFIYDNSNYVPSYKISVSDGLLSTSPVYAIVNFTWSPTKDNKKILTISLSITAIVSLTTAVIVGLCIKYNRAKKGEENTISEKSRLMANLNTETHKPMELEDGTIQIVSTINHSDIDFKEEWGSGSFGEVWKGTWQSSDVAIKVLNKSILTLDVKVLDAFKREIAIMRDLSHLNIVQLYGICFSEANNEYCIIMELMTGGNLSHYIHNKTQNAPWYPQDWNIIMGITAGLTFMHNKNILHRDLKPDNILLTENLIPKITDFGCSKIKDAAAPEMTGDIGSLVYMAPEVIIVKKTDQKTYGKEVDVYSYGVILWEIFTKEEPYEDVSFGPMGCNFKEKITKKADSFRPKIPQNCPKSFAELIKKCWAQRGNKRLTMNEVKKQLPNIEKSMLSI